MKRDSEIWENEFRDFLESEAIPPPAAYSCKVVQSIVDDLNPSLAQVYLKIAAITAVAGPLSLLVCPQMGVGAHHSPLMHLFMQFGPLTCHAICASFFSLLCLTLSSFLIQPEELRVLRNNRVTITFAISTSALAVFVCTTPVIFSGVALIWLLGAVIGGITGVEIGHLARLAR